MKRAQGQLRIIGGEWRSRRIEFDAGEELRATPDRVRQTLFDWVTPMVEGARCLDLFAGSGALGLEALSRGAAHVTFCETGRRQLDRIRAALATFNAQARAEVMPADGVTFLELTPRRFDLVFLDPPFGSPLLGAALERLHTVLAPNHRVFMEWQNESPPQLPAGYELVREKQAGQVSYALATYSHANGRARAN
jgi:16S rRNA (guanine966-N2)-methyltransferase